MLQAVICLFFLLTICFVHNLAGVLGIIFFDIFNTCLQVLVALACDLGLDTLPCCAEAHKWAWFRRYCSAARVAAAIVTRSVLPPVFTEEVGKKIQDIASDGESGSSEHLDHDVFKLEQDEQLLQWLNRWGCLGCFVRGFVGGRLQTKETVVVGCTGTE